MKAIRSAIDEIVGLFVDDWRFALLLVLWVGVGWMLARQMPSLAGTVFFCGLAGIMLAFVYVRAANR